MNQEDQTGDGVVELGNRGRCWGREFCPHPGEPCIDGCYFCGRPVGALSGDHDHTECEKGRYSCVCEAC